MKRLLALLLLLALILLTVWALLLMLSAPAQGMAVLLLASGCGWLAWRIDPKPPTAHDLVATLPAPAAYRVRFRSAGVIGMALLAIAVLGMLVFASMLALDVRSPGWEALIIACALVLPMVWRALGAEHVLLVDARGVDHWRIGMLPWSAIDAVRMSAVTHRGTTFYGLVLGLADPQRHLGQLGAWRRRWLNRQGSVHVSLQLTDAQPLWLFEAATRYRNAHRPHALTGWTGDDAALRAVAEALAGAPANAEPVQAARRARLQALLTAMQGGWSPLDTVDTTRQRRELMHLRERLLEAQLAELDRRVDEHTRHGGTLTAAAFDALFQQAQHAAQASVEGRRARQLETALQQAMQQLQRRQDTIAWLLIGATVLLYLLARFST